MTRLYGSRTRPGRVDGGMAKIYRGKATLIQGALQAEVNCYLASDKHSLVFGRFTFVGGDPGLHDGPAELVVESERVSVAIDVHPDSPPSGGCFEAVSTA
jgi:hypothetical protein